MDTKNSVANRAMVHDIELNRIVKKNKIRAEIPSMILEIWISFVFLAFVSSMLGMWGYVDVVELMLILIVKF